MMVLMYYCTKSGINDFCLCMSTLKETISRLEKLASCYHDKRCLLMRLTRQFLPHSFVTGFFLYVDIITIVLTFTSIYKSLDLQ